MIAERFFKKEVLGRRGSLQILETEFMKMLIHQLVLHRFSKTEGDSPVSSSPDKLQAEAAAAGSAFGQVCQSLCTQSSSQDILVGWIYVHIQ